MQNVLLSISFRITFERDRFLFRKQSNKFENWLANFHDRKQDALEQHPKKYNYIVGLLKNKIYKIHFIERDDKVERHS